jgi:hypothetical protein
MILVLSCFDLAVVSITHPLVIASAIYLPIEGTQRTREKARIFISYAFYGFSMSALFTLNIERVLALTCPFVHQVYVTRKRLVCFFAVLSIMAVGPSPLVYISKKTIMILNIFATTGVSLMLFSSTYANYKILAIAKSKRTDKRVSPNAEPAEGNKKRKKPIISLKSISTCSLAVCCLFFCSCAHIVYSALHFVSGVPSYNVEHLLSNLWSNTFLSINSTLNCVIFFWRNSILRREGMKIINALKKRVDFSLMAYL